MLDIQHIYIPGVLRVGTKLIDWSIEGNTLIQMIDNAFQETSKKTRNKVDIDYDIQDGEVMSQMPARGDRGTSRVFQRKGLEDIPPPPLILCTQRAFRAPPPRLAASIKLPDTFDLLQRKFKELFLLDDVEVSSDAGVLTREPLYLCVGEMAA